MARLSQDTLPGLSDWAGVEELSKRLKHVQALLCRSRVSASGSVASLVKFAGRLLFGPCRNVLVTDLTWPAYGKLLARQRAAADARCTRMAIRKWILTERPPPEAVVEAISSAFIASGCDGLFLPLVDNFGIRLPVKEIVERIRTRATLRFVAIDGAQALGHVPPELKDNYCDIFIAGCHKWLRAYLPMGVAIYGRPETRGYITSSLSRWRSEGWLDDPLLAFMEQLTSGHWKSFGETVQLPPLFTANAACLDAGRIPAARQECIRPANRLLLRHLTIDTRWRMIEPHALLGTRIALLKQSRRNGAPLPASVLSKRWLEQDVSVTALSRGLIRVSLPDLRFTDSQLDTVKRALLAT